MAYGEPQQPNNKPAIAIGGIGIALAVFAFIAIAVFYMWMRLTFAHVANIITSMPSGNLANPVIAKAGAGPIYYMLHPDAVGPKLRRYRDGDNWTYNVSMTVVDHSGQTHSGNGTQYESISAVTINGQPAFKDDSQLTVTFDDGSTLSLENATYFNQDSDGDYMEVGEYEGSGHPTVMALQPEELLPGDWSSAPSVQSVTTFADMNTAHENLSITPGSTVQTIASGQKVEVWSFTETTAGSNMSEVDTQGQFSPACGQPVNFTQSDPNADAGSIKVTATMVRFNLASGA